MRDSHKAAGFQAPLILNASGRGAIVMIRDTAVTVLLWLVWAVLFCATVGYFWVPPFAQDLIPVALPADRGRVLALAALCLLAALLICLALLGRMHLDRWRYSGADRRRSLPMPGEDALAADFRVQPAQLKLWANARRMVIHHDDDGDIQRVEILEGLAHDAGTGTGLGASLLRGVPPPARR